MRIQITLHRTHPHFGGRELIAWRFSMNDGLAAQAKYENIAKEVEASNGYAFVEIGVVLIGDDVDRVKKEAST